MDLFDYLNEKKAETEGPLAMRLRPRSLDEVVGQQHILGKDKMLYRAIMADKLSSVILFGPPGTGKTTMARITKSAAMAILFVRRRCQAAFRKPISWVLPSISRKVSGSSGERSSSLNLS